MSLVLSIISRDLYTTSNICNICFVMSSGSSGNCNGYQWLIRHMASAGEYTVTKVNLVSINIYPTVTISRNLSGEELAKLTNMSFKTFDILNPPSINCFVSLNLWYLLHSDKPCSSEFLLKAMPKLRSQSLRWILFLLPIVLSEFLLVEEVKLNISPLGKKIHYVNYYKALYHSRFITFYNLRTNRQRQCQWNIPNVSTYHTHFDLLIESN